MSTNPRETGGFYWSRARCHLNPDLAKAQSTQSFYLFASPLVSGRIYRYCDTSINPYYHPGLTLPRCSTEASTKKEIQNQELTRISHQAASNTDNALALWNRARMIKNTLCYSSMPITVQAGLRVRKLGLQPLPECCRIPASLPPCSAVESGISLIAYPGFTVFDPR